MANLKRLRDTDNKKIVWAIPTNEPYKKLQVWTNDDGSKLYVYRNSQYLELDTSNATVAEYGHYWKQLDDEMVGYYLTSEPTNLYNWDEGDEASYQFVDWDGTVLKSGTVEEGETPTAPADPTRESTAQYSYTFNGWNPAVGPITKKTTYTATYTATLREYKVDVQAEEGGTVDDTHFTFPYGTAVSAEENVLTFGTGEDAVVVTATPNAGYEFVEWTAENPGPGPKGGMRGATKTAVRGTLPSMITETTVFKAVFQVEVPNVAFLADDGSDSYPIIVLFSDGSDVENFVEIEADDDPEILDPEVVAGVGGIFADSRLEIDGNNVFETLFNGASVSYIKALAGSGTIGDTGTIIAGFFTALKNLFDNPTAENLATAQALLAGYEVAEPQTMFVTWTPTTYTVTIQSNNTSYGTVDESELTVNSGTSLSAVSNVLSVGSTDVTATAETGYEFVSWTVGGESLPATVTSNMTITATFQAEPVPPQPTGDYRYIKWHVTGTWNTGDPSDQLRQIMASRFVITDGVNAMTYPAGTTASTNATNDGSTYSETPANLLDGSTSTKMVIGWDDTPYSAIDVTIDLGSGNGFDPTEYDHYQWYTANDSFGGPEVYRNPVSWEIQLSEDGTTWETWDTQTNATLVEENQVAAGTWSLTAPL